MFVACAMLLISFFVYIPCFAICFVYQLVLGLGLTLGCSAGVVAVSPTNSVNKSGSGFSTIADRLSLSLTMIDTGQL